MRVFRELNNLSIKNAVLTIGTFDGVHTGHQKIIGRINEIAREISGESVILTFHPHPRLVLNPNDHSLKLLNTLESKITLLEKYKVDNLIIAPFSDEFSKMTGEEYVRNFLWGKIHPKKVVIGYNHRFGNNREGDIELLRRLGETLGFSVEEISKQMVEHISVSSTKIRNALLEGDVDFANSLLGHHYFITGKVVKGERMGTKLGFPTANIFVENPNKLIPANGVYAVKVNMDGKEHRGMLNIGTRPTFNGTHHTIEAHIFNFDKDIYDAIVRVDFVSSIRKEQKFDSAEKLVEQLLKDKEISERIFNNQ